MSQFRGRFLALGVAVVAILCLFPPERGFYIVEACGGGTADAIVFSLAGLNGLTGLAGAIPWSYYQAVINEALDKTFGKGKVRADQWQSSSKGKPIDCPRDLDCDGSKPCRWRNDERGLDQGLYMRGNGTIRDMKMMTVFGSSPAPKSPFILTAARQNETGRYFISDTIPKAGPKAKIQFKYWNSPGVRLKVCIRYPKTKKLVKCSPSFIRSMDDVLPPQRVVQVGPVDRPFELIFWDGGYKNKPGGLGFLDDMKYSDPDLCSKDKTAITAKANAAISLSPNNNEDAPFPKATENRGVQQGAPDTKAQHRPEPRLRQRHKERRFKMVQKREVLLDDGLFDGLEDVNIRHAESVLEAHSTRLDLRRLTTDDSNVQHVEDLDCNFEQTCRWGAGTEDTSLRFLNASGTVNNLFLKSCVVPKNPFALFVSSSPDDEATLSSQPMRFRRNGVVRFSACLSTSIELRVCTRCAHNWDSFYFCSLPQSSQEPTQRSLPLLFNGDGLCQVVFTVKNASDKGNTAAGAFAILDDITLSMEEPFIS